MSGQMFKSPKGYDGFEDEWMYAQGPTDHPRRYTSCDLADNPKSKVDNCDLMILAEVAASCSHPREAVKELQLIKPRAKAEMLRAMERMIDWIRRGDDPPWEVFGQGNMKLPFMTWSILPLVTCPGAGDCAAWCYSFRSWRYPFAFFRQFGNTLLLRFWPDIIAKKYQELDFGDNQHPAVRLYVDGDFTTIDQIDFWMNLIQTPKGRTISHYAYTKSWDLFLAYDRMAKGMWPRNFLVNISSGSIHNDSVKAQMKKLTCVRGEFVAIDKAEIEAQESVGERWAANPAKKSDAQIEAEARAKWKNLQAWMNTHGFKGSEGWYGCPGKCAYCVPQSGGQYIHACGWDKYRGKKIAIGIH
jgi:hypothetical protein